MTLIINDNTYSFFITGSRRGGSIRFRITDGLNQAGGGKTFAFNVRVKDLTLHLDRHESLDVFPMMQVSLDPANLLVSTSDKDTHRTVRFLVKQPPRLGRLLLRVSGRNNEQEYIIDAKNFTQQDVNEGRVLYEHRRPFSNLTAFDVISLEAMADYARQRLDIALNIRISVTVMIPGVGIDRYIGAEGVTVDEGGLVVLRTRNLNTSGILDFIRRHRQQGVAAEQYYQHRMQPPSLRLQVSALPKHGDLLISKDNAMLGQTFTQLDVDRGFIAYGHDHSDTLQDTFGVAIYLEGDKSEKFGDGKGQTADVLLYDGRWNVSVMPVNDRQFRLLTEAPSMTVVQKQSKAITANMLYVEDPDTPPHQIVYDVMNPPGQGALVLADNISKSVDRFTQADINHKKLVYFHNPAYVHQGGGAGLSKSTEFYFRVSDGKYSPIYRHFRIHIIPLQLVLVNSSSIEIQQGTKTGYISAKNMGASTNGQRDLTYYNITSPPKGGLVYMNDAPTAIFGQINVDNEEVVYMQTDMTLARDNFTATITNEDGAIMHDVVFNISVVPLVRQRDDFVCSASDLKTPILQKVRNMFFKPLIIAHTPSISYSTWMPLSWRG